MSTLSTTAADQARAELRGNDQQQQQTGPGIAGQDREIPTSTALALENAGHWIFLSHETQVLEAIDEFIARLH